MKVGINNFVRRQIATSRFSHFGGTFTRVVELAEAYLATGRQGYRDGVLEVDVPPEGFFSGVVQLKPGDRLIGKFEARREGEEPRKHTGAVAGTAKKMPAKAVSLILYRHDVLGKDASTEAEWELVSINARPTEEPEPINAGALMANHFGASGGTPTNMSDSEFVAALKKSWEYWKDKSMLEVEG